MKKKKINLEFCTPKKLSKINANQTSSDKKIIICYQQTCIYKNIKSFSGKDNKLYETETYIYPKEERVLEVGNMWVNIKDSFFSFLLIVQSEIANNVFICFIVYVEQDI